MQTIVEPQESKKTLSKNENKKWDSKMPGSLTISMGEYSDKGRKEINHDFHGCYYPNEPLLTSKGIALAIADGINNSYISQVASETSVAGFLDDYYCTNENWSVKRSAQLVLNATNSWLYSQSKQTQGRDDKDNNNDYVCTFSALILKASTAHILHIGDTRIYRIRGNNLEQLTTDHCHRVSDDISYLNRGLGIYSLLDIDYQSTPIKADDVFLMTTDGVYEHISDQFIIDIINEQNQDLDLVAELIVEQAYQVGSTDSLTAQLVKIEELASI